MTADIIKKTNNRLNETCYQPTDQLCTSTFSEHSSHCYMSELCTEHFKVSRIRETLISSSLVCVSACVQTFSFEWFVYFTEKDIFDILTHGHIETYWMPFMEVFTSTKVLLDFRLWDCGITPRHSFRGLTPTLKLHLKTQLLIPENACQQHHTMKFIHLTNLANFVMPLNIFQEIKHFCCGHTSKH